MQQQNITNLRAEREVIGGLIRSKDIQQFEDVTDIITHQHFSDTKHQILFKAIADLYTKDNACSGTTLIDYLDRQGSLNQAGDEEYIIKLDNEASPQVLSAMAYQVLNAYRRQSIAQLTTKAQQKAVQGKDEAPDIISTLESDLDSIVSDATNKIGFRLVADIANETLDHIDKNFKSGPGITGIDTGFNSINKITSGWQNGDMIVLAARPSMGKTTLALNFIENALKADPNRPVVIFSLEMPARSLIMRIISRKTGINLKQIIDGSFPQRSWDSVKTALTDLKKMNLIIDDTPSITPSYMQSTLRRIKRNIGSPQLIMLDYMQLMQDPTYKNNRVQEISHISQQLKHAARIYDCPFIALSQLNREVDKRQNKSPVLSDIRDSGAIEQDADLILFLYREEQYDEDTDHRGIADISIAKNRNGETGRLKLFFRGETAYFTDLDTNHESKSSNAI